MNSLHQRALEIAGLYQKVEAELLDVLIQIDAQKLYLEHECPSLFAYATKVLGLTESVAYAFISVARKSREAPVLAAEIMRGALSVSKACRVVSVITTENQSEWIEKAKSLSRLSLEREVARVNPRAMTPEKVNYVSDTRVGLTLEQLLNCFLDRHDPVRKAERSQRRAEKKVCAVISAAPPTLPGQSNVVVRQTPKPSNEVVKQARKPIDASTRHQLVLRDGFRCNHQYPDGERCDATRWLEAHHLTAVARGGTNALENLATLCSRHHAHLHGRSRQACAS